MIVTLSMSSLSCAAHHKIEAKPGYNFVIDNARPGPDGRLTCHVVDIKVDAKAKLDHWVCR